MTRIAIDCLRCGHFKSLADSELPAYGYEPDTSLVILTRKLVCERCGSRAVRAYRYVEDPDGPPLVPK